MSTGPSSTSHIDHKEQRSFECSRQLRKKPRDLSKKYNRLINPPCWRCKSWEERNSRGVASYGGIDIEDAFANGYISETTMVAHALLELEDYEETDMIWTSDFGSDIATSERSADEMDSRVTEALFHSVSIMDILKPSRRRRRVNCGFEVVPTLRRVLSLEELAESSESGLSEWEHVEGSGNTVS